MSRQRTERWSSLAALVGIGMFLGSTPAWAQTSSSFGSSSLGGSSLGGSSLGGSSLGGSSFGSTSGSGLGGSTGSSGLSLGSGSSLGGSGQGSGLSSGLGGTGGSMTGGTSAYGATGRAGLGGATSTAIGQTSPFGGYYGNPLALGLAGSNTAVGGTAQLRFGTPLYPTLSATTTTIGGLAGAGTRTSTLGGLGGLNRGGITGSIGTGYSGLGGARTGYGSMTGTSIAPRYVATVNFDFRRAPLAQRRADLQQVLSRSSTLSAGRNIQVMADGETVVLRGTVANERDRRHAEALLRLTPGVRDVRNELEVIETTPPPTPLP